MAKIIKPPRYAPLDRRALLGAMAALMLPQAARAFTLADGPRTHLIMRHALAPGGGDPPDFSLRDCSTQRNLNEQGREQARATGDRIRALGIGIDRVLSSQWCRCLETAELLNLGPVEEAPAINSFFSARERGEAQTNAIREQLLAMPADQTALLVTHWVNVIALIDRAPSSGEVFAFSIRDSGEITVHDSFVIAP